MKETSNNDLFDELKKRSLGNEKVLHDLVVMTRKFEELNEKLRQAESYKSNFLSNIRNEINNPLAVILGMSKQLGKSVADPKAAALVAEMIYHEAFELDFQLKNIFIAAEIEAGECSICAARVDVVKLIRSLMDSFEYKAAEKKLNMEFEIGPPTPAEQLHFVTDPEKLSCMLSNLLANAIEYDNTGKRVQIFAEKNKAQLIVRVTDEGIGIAEKDQQKIFDRFVQLDTGTKRRHRGHGLGLSITKALVEMLEGKITVSCPPGKGCVFTLTLNEAGGSGPTDDLSEDSNQYIFDDAQKY